MEVYIETYGCTANFDDSNTMKSLIARAGGSICSSPDVADVIIVNTCGVKHTTEQKILHRISALRREFPGKKLVVAGCLAASGKYAFEEADAVIGINSSDIISAIQKPGYRNISRPSSKITAQKFPISPVTQAIQISTGCLSNCAFCFTKLSRGTLVSEEHDKIIEAARKMIRAGIKEIYLTSQDTGCYGFDRGTNLAELVDDIVRIEGKFMVRIGMANPQHLKRFVRDLLDAMESEKVYKFLHVPVQSGSDKVLRIMKRGHTADDFEGIVRKARKRFPEMSIWTDVIVGHPGEEDEDFEMTVELLKRTVPDHTNISAFSSRPGTEAREMEKVPTDVIKSRTRKLTEVVSRLNLSRNQRWVGWEGEVLVDEYKREKGNWIGRNHAYKPVILKGNFKYGWMKNIRVVSALETGLVGEVI